MARRFYSIFLCLIFITACFLALLSSSLTSTRPRQRRAAPFQTPGAFLANAGEHAGSLLDSMLNIDESELDPLALEDHDSATEVPVVSWPVPGSHWGEAGEPVVDSHETIVGGPRDSLDAATIGDAGQVDLVKRQALAIEEEAPTVFAGDPAPLPPPDEEVVNIRQNSVASELVADHETASTNAGRGYADMSSEVEEDKKGEYPAKSIAHELEDSEKPTNSNDYENAGTLDVEGEAAASNICRGLMRKSLCLEHPTECMWRMKSPRTKRYIATTYTRGKFCFRISAEALAAQASLGIVENDGVDGHSGEGRGASDGVLAAEDEDLDESTEDGTWIDEMHDVEQAEPEITDAQADAGGVVDEDGDGEAAPSSICRGLMRKSLCLEHPTECMWRMKSPRTKRYIATTYTRGKFCFRISAEALAAHGSLGIMENDGVDGLSGEGSKVLGNLLGAEESENGEETEDEDERTEYVEDLEGPDGGGLSPEGEDYAVGGAEYLCTHKSLRVRSRCIKRPDCLWRKRSVKSPGTFVKQTKLKGSYCFPAEEVDASTKVGPSSSDIGHDPMLTKLGVSVPPDGIPGSNESEVSLSTRSLCNDIKSKSKCDLFRECIWLYPKTWAKGNFCLSRGLSRLARVLSRHRSEPLDRTPWAPVPFVAPDLSSRSESATTSVHGGFEHEVGATGAQGYSWALDKEDLECGHHPECATNAKLEQLMNVSGNLKRYDIHECCHDHPYLRIALHATADFFASIGFHDWWLDGSVLIGLVRHKGLMQPLTREGTLSFVVNSNSSGPMRTSKRAYIKHMLRFNQHHRFAPYILRACSAERPSSSKLSPGSVRCSLYDTVQQIPRSRRVLYFTITNADLDPSPTLKLIPRLVRERRCISSLYVHRGEDMLPTPARWVLPTRPCPNVWYGRAMRCPNDAVRYLDHNQLGWKSTIHFRAKAHDGFSIAPPSSSSDSHEYLLANDIIGPDPHLNTSAAGMRRMVIEEFCGGGGLWIDGEFFLRRRE